MCRLLGYVSDSDTDFATVVGPNFEEFVNLSKIHCDGWGITDKSGNVFKEASSDTPKTSLAKGDKLVKIYNNLNLQ